MFYPKWDKKPFKKRSIWWLWEDTLDQVGRRSIGRPGRGSWTGVQVGGEKQLGLGVFWRLSVQDCSGVGYKRGRIKGKFGVELGEGTLSGLGRNGDSHVVRKGT